eukprot:PITA_22764
MHYFLGMEVWWGNGELFISQYKYANEIVWIFRMEGSKPMETPLAGNWRKEDATSRKVVEATVYSFLVERTHRLVALNSVEEEYMVASQATCESIWMRKILVCLFGQQMDPTVIYCDNQSCIKLSENPVFHDQSKHIDIWYHHRRDCVLRRIMLLDYIPTEEKDVDILTKALLTCKFEFHRDMIGVVDNPFLV